MDELTTLDAGFLEAEDSDRHISLAIGGLVILDGPIPNYEALLSTLGARVGACPRLTQKLRLRPLDLGPPTWVADSDFNVTHHVRHVALPAPGDDRGLFGFVADQMATRLDRDRPLWSIWIIEGLAGNRWAMLMKVHHCVGDGIATSHLLSGLCDNPLAASFADRIHAARESAAAEPEPAVPPAAPGISPLDWATGLWTTSLAVVGAAAHAARGTVELSAALLRPAVATSLNGPMTTLRRFAAARVSLADVQQVCQAFGVTVNDVALAALTEGYRDMLIRRGERPRAKSLRTLVPVSVRAAEAVGKADNRVSVMLPYLPVEQENPLARLNLVHTRLTRAKSTGQRQAGSFFVSAANLLPFPLTAWAVRLLTRLPQHAVTTLATNVPGPSETLQVMGRKVVDVLPVPPIGLQLRSGVAMLSYADQLFFGVLADFDAVPDVDQFAHSIEIAVARLVTSSKRAKVERSRAPRRHRSLVGLG